MMTKPHGRDIFVGGLQTSSEIAAIFGDALGVAARGIVPDGASTERQLDAWRENRRIEIYQLERGSDFTVKLAVDLDVPIDVDCFPHLAQTHRIKIAWSVDESAACSDEYVVAFPDGSIGIHPLGFHETPEGWTCRLLPATGKPHN